MNRSAFAAALAALLVVLLPAAAAAGSRTVSPAGNSGDYETVRRALAGLSPGDTLVLSAGVYDWSANIADSTAGLLGGMAIPVGNVTILGRKGAILEGARNTQGNPFHMARGTNTGFKNGPGVNSVTIQGLTFRSFENAIVLLQGDTLSWAAPANAYAAGTRGWILEDLHIQSGPFGISANGRHTDLSIRRCRFEMDPGPDSGRQPGCFAVGVRPFPPSYEGLPERVVIEDNVIFGPETAERQGMFAAVILTAEQSFVRRNSVERFGMGLVVEGRAVAATANRISRCGIGIVAWSTDRLGTHTEGAVISGNEIRSMSRRLKGFLSEFSGSGILLAGVTKSTIADNIVSANAGADIVFGSVRTTPSSKENRVTGNGGVVLISKKSLEDNTVTGSTTMVRDMSKPGEAKAPKPEEP